MLCGAWGWAQQGWLRGENGRMQRGWVACLGTALADCWLHDRSTAALFDAGLHVLFHSGCRPEACRQLLLAHHVGSSLPHVKCGLRHEPRQGRVGALAGKMVAEQTHCAMLPSWLRRMQKCPARAQAEQLPGQLLEQSPRQLLHLAIRHGVLRLQQRARAPLRPRRDLCRMHWCAPRAHQAS